MSDTQPHNQSRLLALPAELRNEIWELALTPDNVDADHAADLLSCTPPGTNLQPVCRQICDETKGLLDHAYRQFWSGTFVLNIDPTRTDFIDPYKSSLISSRLNEIGDGNLKLISRLTLNVGTIGCEPERFEFQQGAWNFMTEPGAHPWDETVAFGPPKMPGFSLLAPIARTGMVFDGDGNALYNVAEFESRRRAMGSGLIRAKEIIGWAGLHEKEIKAAIHWFLS